MESKSGFLFDKLGLDIGGGQCARLDVPGCTEGGGNAGGLSHKGANRHNAEVGVCFVGAGTRQRYGIV